MFGADLAYIDSCIEDEYVSESLLPEYLYPAFRVTNPWHRQSDKTQLETDIIVIAEFSELEGPKPVITIPHDRDTHFDVNEFTVRIMSVDQGSSGQQGFNMQEDYQVLMSDTKENVYAFNHHFVLLDKQARGYSRPFAISYVTPDQRKLLNFHEEISSSFKRIARYIKYGNKLVFKNDLDKFMIDLQYTKDQIVNRFRSTVLSNPSDSDNKLLQSLKTLESQISEVQGILSQLNPTLNDKRLEQRFSKIEERAQVSTEKPKYDSASLQEWESIDTPENVDCRFSSLGNSSEAGSLIFFDSQHYKPKLVEISKGRKFDLHLRGLHELCSWGAKEGVQKLRFIYKYFQQDMSVLQKEKKDVALLDPPSGLVTFGSKYIAANFMTDIDKICISSCCFMRVPGTRSNIETMNLLVRSWSSNDTLSSFKSVPSSFQSIQKEDDTESMLSATSDLYIQRPNSLGSFHLVGSYDSFNLSDSPLTSGLVLDIDHSSIQFGNDSMVDHSEHTNNVSENLKNVTENNGCENTSENSSEKCSNASNQDAQFGTNVQDVDSADIDKNIAGHGKNKSTCIAIDSDVESSCERERSSTIVNDEDANTGDSFVIKLEENIEVIDDTDGKDDKIKKEEVDGKTEANSAKDKINAYVKDDEKEIRTDAFSEKEKNLLNCSRDLENLGSTIVDGHLKCQTGIGVSSCDECQLKKAQTFKADGSKCDTLFEKKSPEHHLPELDIQLIDFGFDLTAFQAENNKDDVFEDTINNDVFEDTISNDVFEGTSTNDRTDEDTTTNDKTDKAENNKDDVFEDTINNDVFKDTINNDVFENTTTNDRTDEDTTTNDRTDEDTTTNDRTDEDTTSNDKTDKAENNKDDVFEDTINNDVFKDIINNDVFENTTTNDRTDEDTTTNDRTDEDTTTNGRTDEDTSTNGRTDEDTTTNGRTDEDTTTNDRTDEDTTTNDRTDEDTTTNDRTDEDTTTNDKTDKAEKNTVCIGEYYMVKGFPIMVTDLQGREGLWGQFFKKNKSNWTLEETKYYIPISDLAKKLDPPDLAVSDENRNCNHGDGISRAETETDLDKTDIFKFDSCTDILSLGFGILQVVLSYNYIQNVIFSLLTGRTVVVIGAPAYEEEVRQVITGLKLFLPGCHRCVSSCVLWSGKAITFKDLSEVKLIGICRPEKKSVDRMIPKSVQPYITLLDVERRMIKSPVYQGSLITTILSRKKSFKTEDSFINFIKMLLCDFSSKAFIFFHSFCLGSVGTLIHENEEVTKKSDFAKKTSTNFLSKLGVQDNDVHIIEYLTELVKYQHIEDHYMSLNLTGAPPRPVHKDVHPCQIFKC